jgi:hypothetical protein
VVDSRSLHSWKVVSRTITYEVTGEYSLGGLNIRCSFLGSKSILWFRSGALYSWLFSSSHNCFVHEGQPAHSHSIFDPCSGAKGTPAWFFSLQQKISSSWLQDKIISTKFDRNVALLCKEYAYSIEVEFLL